MKTCVVCGEELTGRQRKYCGEKCQDVVRQLKKRSAYQAYGSRRSHRKGVAAKVRRGF